MWKSRLSRLASIAALGTFAVAYDSSTGPDLETTLDTEAALSDYEALDAAFSSTEFAGFQALGGRTPFGASPAAIDVVAAFSAPRAEDGGRAFALNLARRIHAADATLGPAATTRGPATAPIISDTHRGVTFVYDLETDDYAADPERTGAPETGVRFIPPTATQRSAEAVLVQLLELIFQLLGRQFGRNHPDAADPCSEMSDVRARSI
jgi:hypothetical protein